MPFPSLQFTSLFALCNHVNRVASFVSSVFARRASWSAGLLCRSLACSRSPYQHYQLSMMVPPMTRWFPAIVSAGRRCCLRPISTALPCVAASGPGAPTGWSYLLKLLLHALLHAPSDDALSGGRDHGVEIFYTTLHYHIGLEPGFCFPSFCLLIS